MEQFERYIITSQRVNFRSEPVITEDNIISFVPTNSVFRILSVLEGTTWYQAQLISSGQIGYITSKSTYVADFEPAWLTKVTAIINYLETYLGTSLCFRFQQIYRYVF